MQKEKPIRLKGRAYKKLQQSVVLRDNFSCQVCKRYTLAPPHHIVFKSRGGHDSMENLITLCGPMENDCHRKVHDHKIKLDL